MKFIDYQSKPVIRTASEIPLDATIAYYPDRSEAEVDGTVFKCYEKPKHGDYVVYLSADDVYHCSRAVFHERNIV